MKRMFLMTLVLSVMAMGSAMANDGSANRGPIKKNNIVFVVNPGEIIHGLLCGDCHHDCHKFNPHNKGCDHRHNNRGCGWNKGHDHGKHPAHGPHNNNRSPKRGHGHNNGPKPSPGHGRR